MRRADVASMICMICACLCLPGVSASAPAAEPTVPLHAASGSSGRLDPSLRNEVEAAIDRGLDWLKANQRPDGSWSDTNFPALTALPLWAFARSQHPDWEAVVDKAVRYLLALAQEDGSIYRHVPGRKGGGLVNYNTAICMTALHATGRPEVTRAVQKARTFIAGAQHLGGDEYSGGFGYDKSTGRAYTDLLNTYYAVQAMRLTESAEETRPSGEQRADIDWAETVRFIERMQSKPESGATNAGGFVYNPSDPKAGTFTNAAGVVYFRSYGSITYAGMLALVYAKVDRDDVRVRSALDWAERHWTLEENPGMGQEGLYFFYHILSRSLDVSGVNRIHRMSGSTVDWREDVARKLVSVQKIDGATGLGYWVNPVGRYWENNEVLATSYALLGLESL